MRFFFLKSYLVTFALMFAQLCHADFGEIDILVQESIDIHFQNYGRSVDLTKLSYFGEPQLNENQLSVYTSVWAEQRLISPYWGWHSCTTVIEVTAPGQYIDLGSKCYFEFD